MLRNVRISFLSIISFGLPLNIHDERIAPNTQEEMPKMPVTTPVPPKGPPSPALSAPSPSLSRFPSPPLVLMSVLSFFLATAAFASAVFSFNPIIIVLSAIAFCLTVPYHIFLYLDAQNHRRSLTDCGPIFISPNCITYGFLLVPLWILVFFINVVFCVETCCGGRLGPIIVATVWSGLEWMTLFFNALKCAHEVWRVEKVTASTAEHQFNAATAVDGSGNITNPGSPPDRPPSKLRHVFLISFILCTLTFVLSINVSIVALANLITFLVTAPHHISLYVASLRPRSPAPLLARPTGVLWAFALAALWCWVFVLNILVGHELWRQIVTGIFGGMEALIIIGLAARSVLDTFAEGQIKI
ncbi:hypothetical protein D9615_009705 [Tricholomella constricta]|uniref:Uncharacterized protein n=1 Tax=Tricholomella constricta TaxID=117010 RepID=A0A8H5GUU8_9AGAR|nr:hypothetical protein D9615_009705 [Tricholomella constricta]